MPAQKPGQSRQDYETPLDFLHALTDRLQIKTFLFDFAADSRNRKAVKFWDETADALSKTPEQWARMTGGPVLGGWGWCNPPYGNIAPWAMRCLETCLCGGRVAFLVPASVGSNWYRDFIHEQHGVQTLFLNGRLNFVGENWRELINPKTGKFYTSEPLYPKDCICVLFGTGKPYAADVWTWKQ